MTPRPEPPEEVVDEFVRQHPDGAEFEMIAAVFSCSHQRIQQVYAKGIKRLKAELEKRGYRCDYLL